MDKLVKTFEEFGISGPGVLLILLAILVMGINTVAPELYRSAIDITIVLTPLWLPAILFAVFWHLWLNYIRSEAIKNDTYTLLEIRLPREISKSPLAMETVLSGMHIGIGETTFIDRYWAGKTRPWFSLEIVSIEGEIHFFIWTRTFLKELIESQIYAQYPTVEIYEVEDYALPIALDLEKTNLWGCDFKLSEPDPIPIKTYIDYGLDKDPKEEFKINPLASQLEFFGSIGKGEQLWMQIIIRVNRNEKHKAGTLFGKKGWKDEAQEEIDKIIKAATFKTEDIKMPTVLNLSKGQAENVAAIERSISKLGYDCGIRGIYFADKDKFNPKNIVGLVHVMKQYSSNTLNKFGPARWMIPFNYPWQDFRGKRQNRARHQLLEAYKRRSYFHPPFKTQPFVLSTEELATLFHFPGEVVQTPTLSRVPSTKSEAPSNLPT